MDITRRFPWTRGGFERDGRSARYTAVAATLHWVIAVAVITMIALGWWMQSIPKDPIGPRMSAFNLHKSIGLTILVAMLVRLAWRASHRPPPLPSMPRWQAAAARANHALLYVSLFLMPIAGFVGSAFSGRPIVYFGHPLPVWFASNDALSHAGHLVHLAASWILVAAFTLHIAATLKHHLVDGHRLIARMWPLSRPRAPVRSLSMR